MGGLLESTLRVVTGPLLSRFFAQENRSELASLFRQSSSLLLLVSGPVYATLIVLGEPVLRLFGPEFSAGRTALSIIALALLVESAFGMLQTMLLMGGKSHWQLQNKTIQLAILIVGTWMLVPRLGLTGAAVAWAAGVVINLTLAVRQVHRLCGAGPGVDLLALPATLVLATFVLMPLAAIRMVSSPPMLVALVCVTGLIHLSLCLLLRSRLGLLAYWGRT